ncbi:hypothetical protein ACLB2K_027979 [Fragaria x ananassa]
MTTGPGWVHGPVLAAVDVCVDPDEIVQRQDGLDRLYILLDLVRRKVKEKREIGCVDVWRRREMFVMNGIIGVRLNHEELTACLSLIKVLLNRDYTDPVLVSKLGYIQMQMGDLEGAKSSFNAVQGMMEKGAYGLSGYPLVLPVPSSSHP